MTIRLLLIILLSMGIIGGLLAIVAMSTPPKKEAILKFIQDNPDQSAIKLVYNGESLVEYNGDKMMPLASTVKLIIAIEYAYQASAGVLQPDELIPLTELDKYYIPNTDGGAHPLWLKRNSQQITNEAISIRDITKGMIRFSSNANTEWLCERLGLSNINARIDSLGMENHAPVYNIVSALFVGTELFPQIKGDSLVQQLQALSEEEYIAATELIHKQLQQDSSYRQTPLNLPLPFQRIWSDRLPASTVNEYAALMQKINSRTFFDTQTQAYLDEILEFLLENPRNRAWLAHTGMKGGSTAFVLTKALYATDKDGNQTELAYFFDDLGILVNATLQRSMNDFELGILTDSTFREEVRDALKQ